ncbi:hypothetical protein KBY58_06730 [Cyanobium sp. HWJ4-Hawea]|uniref:hypothetical protein n=1 Tax=Cyanobium sp. HWJ4-Hawea TaxID=2823713 RepID=UPI0020CFB053|nr:hypothetical protein [Cyanobium sp. HWJ4-Hawea]MCP9809125.1 hypothetical protein [Cyanobium sp. HWJ4-Hawea]
MLELLSMGCGWFEEIGKLGSLCFCLNSSASKLRSFSSSSFVRFSASSERLLASAILLSTSGSRRQLSIDKNNRQRGKDEPEAPLLVDGEAMGARGAVWSWEVEVVIGGENSNQGNYKTTNRLEPTLGIQTNEWAFGLPRFWRRLNGWIGHRAKSDATPVIVHQYLQLPGPSVFATLQEQELRNTICSV